MTFIPKTRAFNVDEIDTSRQFHQCFMSSFCMRGAQKHVRDSQVVNLFTLLGSARTKAVRNYVGEIDPCTLRFTDVTLYFIHSKSKFIDRDGLKVMTRYMPVNFLIKYVLVSTKKLLTFFTQRLLMCFCLFYLTVFCRL